MTQKTTSTPLSTRRLIVAALLILLAVVVVKVVGRAGHVFSDARRCADGGCAEELPGRWSDGERTLTLDGDGTFVAHAVGRATMRGTWTATKRQLCFVSDGERTCMSYQYMGEMLVLDAVTYSRR